MQSVPNSIVGISNHLPTICRLPLKEDTRPEINVSDGESDVLKWVRALKAFQHAAKAHKVKYGRPMVIVYNNVSRLDPEIISILQNSAKDNANSQTYIAVFVSSEGSVPKIMENNSSYSRASDEPIEIGDLTKNESIEYLVNKRKIKEAAADSLYELVDGHFIDLEFVAVQFLAGRVFTDIKQAILRKIEKKLKSAQICPKQKYHEVEEADEVLEKNVFACHPGKNTVTFQPQSVELYIMTEADDFGVKIIDLTPTDEGPLLRVGSLEGSAWTAKSLKTSCHLMLPHSVIEVSEAEIDASVCNVQMNDETNELCKKSQPMVVDTINKPSRAASLGCKLQDQDQDDDIDYVKELVCYIEEVSNYGFEHIIVIGDYIGLLFMDCFGRVFDLDAMGVMVTWLLFVLKWWKERHRDL
ncbi:hypothetical protein RclHR1_05510009 [Rhizophagus clarus]|uniref:Uncharacterized protein n=1 Tax=Rhizophagus clarus TaxID=94130 RepID=A0A2Z6RMB8_9GLOM|nr:hypothetical protein RclHR1_05510009 [Rhizophagus clarus]